MDVKNCGDPSSSSEAGFDFPGTHMGVMSRHVTAPSLPLRYGHQVMLDLGLRQRPGGVDRQVKHFTAGGLEPSPTGRFYLNLGCSLVTTPTSNSVALKSIFSTDDRHEIANWGKMRELYLRIKR